MLTEADREEISRGIAEHAEGRVIAERIGRHPSVVCRDIARHGGRAEYRAVLASRSAVVARCRPKVCRLDADPELRERVLGKLRGGCSPDQVAGRLRHPAEVADRAVPGHWEGDLVIGRAGRSAMATLVERTSRYTVPVALPAGRRDAATTANALIGSVAGMPTALVKTLTWDQGSEMARHAAFTLATTVEVFFAHPHSPWERGTNENTNGLLREYFPKGTQITDDQTYLDLVARELNNRPRRILGYRTPAEVFTDLLTSSIATTS